MKSKITIISILAILLMPMLSLAGPVPDTGQTKCYNNTEEIPCPQPGEPFYGQDAQYDGPARSYTKLGQNGVELPDAATQGEGWIMTRDNITGLIWEVKTSDGSIHDKDNLYTWYNSSLSTFHGLCGVAGDGTDTEDFINILNEQCFGGFSDWRLPSAKELLTIIDSGVSPSGPSVDLGFFPLTEASYYWSATDYYISEPSAWRVSFENGLISGSDKSNFNFVRAVRSGE